MGGRSAFAALLVLAVLAVAVPTATAQGGGDEPAPPTELWEQFPLDSERSPSPPREENQGSSSQTERGERRSAARTRAASDDGGLPIGAVAIGAIVLLLAGAAAVTLRRRRPERTPRRAEPAPQRPAAAATSVPRDEAWLDEPEVEEAALPPAHSPEPIPAPAAASANGDDEAAEVPEMPRVRSGEPSEPPETPRPPSDEPAEAPEIPREPPEEPAEPPEVPRVGSEEPAEPPEIPRVGSEEPAEPPEIPPAPPEEPVETAEPEPAKAGRRPPEPPEPYPLADDEELRDDVIPFPTARTRRIGRRAVPETARTALGYVSAPGAEGQAPDLEAQTEAIRAACERHGFESVEVVRDVELHQGPELERPGLVYAIDRLEAEEAGCLVVTSLERLTTSAADLGVLIDRLGKRRIRLIVLDIELDTGNPDGRLAAEALAKIGTLERRTLDEGTPKGLQEDPEVPRTGRPAVADRPELKQRIAEMRARGLTLQAIADTLNAEGVPTLRGGAEWRPSSVQAAAGYKRPRQRAKKNDGGDSDAGDTSNSSPGR